jgi:hypothetical protein
MPFPIDMSVLVVLASTVVAIVMSISFSIVGMVAFKSGSNENSPKVFGLFFLQLSTIAATVIIVVSAVWLLHDDKIKPEACMTLLGSVAGYVLGRHTSS